jgi:hypothetical protein
MIWLRNTSSINAVLAQMMPRSVTVILVRAHVMGVPELVKREVSNLYRFGVPLVGGRSLQRKYRLELPVTDG